jgi:hypothetical protein
MSTANDSWSGMKFSALTGTCPNQAVISFRWKKKKKKNPDQFQEKKNPSSSTKTKMITWGSRQMLEANPHPPSNRWKKTREWLLDKCLKSFCVWLKICYPERRQTAPIICSVSSALRSFQEPSTNLDGATRAIMYGGASFRFACPVKRTFWLKWK